MGKFLVLISLLTVLLGNSAAQPAPPKVHHVVIQGMKYQPATLSVNSNDIVIWTNKDIMPHTVTEQAEKGWSSPSIGNGKTWKMVVKESSNYYCSFHPTMKGKIVVR